MTKYNPSIGIITQSLLKGGAEKQSVLLAQGLGKNYKVHFIVFYGEKTNTELLEHLKNISGIKINLLRGSFVKKLIYLFRILRENQIHIIINYLLLPNIVGGIVGKLAGVPISVGGIRNSRIEYKKLIFYKLCAKYINDYTIINSISGYRYFLKMGGGLQNTRVIYNSIGEAVFNDKSIENSKIINILSVGRFETQKDYYTALRAIELLKESGFKFIYRIIGWGSEHNKVINDIKNLKLESYVRILIDPENISSYYYNADIFLQTSIFEGMSNAIMEAMLHKLPIVATDVGDNNILLNYEQQKFLCQPKDYTQLSKCLCELCSSFEVRKSLGLNNFKHVTENFSQKIFENKYDNFIKSIALNNV